VKRSGGLNSLAGCRAFLLALGVAALPTVARAGAEIRIVNTNAANEGFNDPTAVEPVGNNPGTTLGAQRRIAFQYAAALWAATLGNRVFIRISAKFAPLTCTATSGILGAAAPSEGFSRAGVTYSPALANELQFQQGGSTPLDANTPEITATFNSDWGTKCDSGGGFYYGLDNKAPTNKDDVVNVILHEFAHGLGYFGPFNSWSRNVAVESNNFALLSTLGDSAAQAAEIIPFNLSWVGTRVRAVVNAGEVLTDHNPVLNVSGGPSDGFLMLAASFGGTPANITKPLAIVHASGGGSARDACEPLDQLSGAIVFAERNSACFVIDRARNAQAAGASAIVVGYDQDGGIPVSYVGLDDGGVTVTIPVYGVSREDGATIEGLFGNGTPSAAISTNTRRAGTNARGDALLYTPSIFKQGSTLSHWDLTASPSLLMEPQINPQLSRNLDLTPASLEDVGWTVQHDVSIGATKLDRPELYPGEPARFIVQVVNRGSQPASGVVVHHQPDPALVFTSNSQGCTTAFPCSFDAIEPGGVRTFIAEYSVQGSPTSVTMGFSITAGGNSTNPSASVSATTATAADLSVTGSGPTTVPASGTGDVVFTVNNNGPGTATTTTLAATVDLGGSVTGYSGDCTGTTQCSLGDLTSGASKTVHVAVKYGSSAGNSTVTGTASNASGDLDGSNNSAAVKTVITGGASSGGCTAVGGGPVLFALPMVLLWARRRRR
jgi:uncharacterized repeat protein (TIGR01451 family)/uncharacterized protein (TIGR03382 family)